jgi:uncharacterized protein YndB with AHSA1/START domain
MATPQPGQNKSSLTLEVRRTFAFPRERVFAAWADHKQLEQWMCRDVSAHTVIHHQQEVRTGGHYVLEVHDREKNEIYWGQGTYREVTPPEKIVFTWHWTKKNQEGENLHPQSPETVVTVQFHAHGDVTEVVLTHGPFATKADYNDHQGGWNGCFDLLEKVVAERSWV